MLQKGLKAYGSLYYYLMNEIKKRFSVKEEITEDSYMHQAFDVLMNGIKNKEIG